MLLETKTFFHTKRLIPQKNPDCHKFLFPNDGGHKLGHFGIFDELFPFLVFFKL